MAALDVPAAGASSLWYNRGHEELPRGAWQSGLFFAHRGSYLL